MKIIKESSYLELKNNQEIFCTMPKCIENKLMEGAYKFTDHNEYIYIEGCENNVSSINRSNWDEPHILWLRQILWSEKVYNKLLKEGWSYLDAKSVLSDATTFWQLGKED